MNCLGAAATLISLLLMLVGVPAQAHTRSESHSSWVIDKRLVRTTITFSDKEAENIAHGRRPSDAEILTYLSPRIGVSAGGDACSPTVPGRMLEAATGYRRSEYVFDCLADKNLVFRFEAFFDLVPSHIDFAQLQLADGDVVEQLFMQGDTRFDLAESQGGRYKSAGFIDFVKMMVADLAGFTVNFKHTRVVPRFGGGICD